MSLAARYASLLAFVQSRAFCPTGQGGGVDNSCAAKPLDANDPEAVKKFLSQMQKETGLDVHGRPLPQGSPRPTVDSSDRPKSLEQQRLEAAGEWQGKDDFAAQEKQQKTRDYHDDIQPLKNALREAGVGWGAFAQQANQFARNSNGRLTRKEFHYQATEAARNGTESLAKFFDDSGLPELAKKVRGK